jgi:tetratricopeptide (TPR) repeat protein
MRLTAKERVLLHLLEHGRSADEPEVSPDLAQEGVARGAGIELRHVAQFVRPLIEDGLVSERKAHVAGIRQRRKVYALTSSGRASALRLREKVTTQPIRIRDGDTVREGSLHQVLRGLGAKASLLETVRQAEQAGILDLERARHPPEAGLVEQTWDAPRVGTFVGRRRELEEVTSEAGGPRVFVVRGIAGIGKSTFAAKACELLRDRRNLFWHRVRPWETSQTVLASLGRFLEALDRPGLAAILRRGEPQLAAEVLRQDLPDTHAFLVFDDAHEASAEAALVFRMLADAVPSAPDVRVLFLSRRALPFYNRKDVTLERRVREIELGGLDSADAAALLGAGGTMAIPTGLGRRLAGHPLFLELVRTHGPATSAALVDVRRYIEEEIYRSLSGPERTIMKAGCLFRVPVPGKSFLSSPETPYEALLSLQDQSLLRTVGEDRYEIHDTIREFFVSTLTSKERSALVAFATDQLQGLATRASDEGDWASSIAYLSNALRIAESSEAQCVLQEALGDANGRVGDLLAVLVSYRAAIALTPDAQTLARLHRKLAAFLADRFRLGLASDEVEAGLVALGNRASVERGWLYLVRAGIANGDVEHALAEADAESALQVFEQFDEQLGRARALLEAGQAATWTGTASADGTPLAGRRFDAAAALAKALGDPALEAQIHMTAAGAIGYASGDYEAGMAHFRAVESSAAMSDPHFGAVTHLERAWFLLRVGRDRHTAELDLSEARHLARRTHDIHTLADVTYQFAQIASAEGRYAEAGRLNEEAGSELARIGVTYHAANAYFCAVQAYLAADDWGGYERAASALRTPPLRQSLRKDVLIWLSHQGMEAVVRGDLRGFERAFARLFRYAERFPAGSSWPAIRLWLGHYQYSVALRSLGRKHEAEDHRYRALELARAVNNLQAVRTIESDFGERIADTIRQGRKRA